MPLSSSSELPPAIFLSSDHHLLFDYCFTMDLPPENNNNNNSNNNFQSIQSPRKQLLLQGPRPAPLKVRKDSHKIRKPPVPPQQYNSQPQAPPRPPVIIYTVSPKVIHTNPSEFMNLVQRLTGSDQSGGTCSSSSSSSSSMAVGSISTAASSSVYSDMAAGAISPAARFASIERINSRSPELMKKNKRNQQQQDYYDDVVPVVDGIEINTEVERTGYLPGILSPNPASLAPIPPNFFSPPSADPNPLGFFYDLSPVLHSNRNYLETATASFVLQSPSTFISPRIGGSSAGSPSMISPSLDLFNNFFDL